MTSPEQKPNADEALAQVIDCVRAVYERWRRDTPVGQMRQDWENLFKSPCDETPIVRASADGVDVAWIGAEAPGNGTVVYFHGGGFRVGSVLSHMELMRSVAEASGCRVLGVDYRRAPEYLYPAAVEDAATVYAWLLKQGVEARSIVFAGDSAGACLALCAMLKLRDAGVRLPAAAVLMSAWTDLSASGESYETRADVDPIHQRAMILTTARNYLGADRDARDPLVSPLFADLNGLPPLLIQVGDRETVLSDSVGLAAKARAAGVAAKLEVWPGMIHVFQQFPRELPQARDALRSIGAFISEHLSSGVQAGAPNP